MAKSARLKFSSLEYDYQRRYGIMPDYNYTNRLKAGQDAEEAGRLINSRMDALWEERRERHRRETDAEKARLAAECPF